MSKALEDSLSKHIAELKNCKLCPNMIGPVITHRTVTSKIYLCGQAPGIHEGKVGKPFGWTAGKTLFSWFKTLGVDEETFRSRVYMSAACRCFPGKAKSGGDRVPTSDEIEKCSVWMKAEFELLKPQLLIPIGRLAIELYLPKIKLNDAVGTSFRKNVFGTACDIIPLPHPSGASTWFRMEPGKTLLAKGLGLIGNHPVWREVFFDSSLE